MAEISIAGFIISAIGFASTLRNGISKLLEDTTAVGNHERFLQSSRAQVELLSETLETWQSTWWLSEKFPRSLPYDYWGSKQSLILELVAAIRERIGQISATLSKEGNTDAQSSVRKVGQALFIDSIRRGELDWVGIECERLEKLSIFLFQKRHDLRPEKGRTTRTRELAYSHHLASFAINKGATAATVHDMAAEVSYPLMLLLNHSSLAFDVDKRIKRSIEMLAYEELVYRFSLPDTTGRAVNVSCTPFREGIRMDREYGDPQRFETSLNTCLQGDQSLARMHGTIFKVQRTGPIGCARVDQMTTLYDFISQNDADTRVQNDYLYSHFELYDRYQLACELSEWFGLFIRTRWSDNLCLCRLYRIEAEDGLSTAFAKLIQSHNGRDENPCTAHRPVQVVRRLGLLLLEIALGRPIREPTLLQELDIEVHDHEASAASGDARILNRQDRNRKVGHLMGYEYARAVDYCLYKSMLSESPTLDDLLIFNTEVVER